VKDRDCPIFLDSLKEKYPGESENNVYDHFVGCLFGDGGDRKHFIGRLVHHFMTSLNIQTVEELKEPLIRYRVAMPEDHRRFLDALQNIVNNEVIESPNVQHLEFKGQKMFVSVFEVFESDPKSFLPTDAYRMFETSEDGARVICDHIGRMTDGFLLKTYDRLFSPRMGSVFDYERRLVPENGRRQECPRLRYFPNAQLFDPATPARRRALNANASPFKKEPGQKQEGGKEDHGQSKGTRLLTRPARKIRFEAIPNPLPPRHFGRRPVKMKMRHDKLSAHSRSANSPCNPPAGQSLLKFCRARL